MYGIQAVLINKIKYSQAVPHQLTIVWYELKYCLTSADLVTFDLAASERLAQAGTTFFFLGAGAGAVSPFSAGVAALFFLPPFFLEAAF